MTWHWMRRGMDNVAAISLAVTLVAVLFMGGLSYNTIQRFLRNDARVTRSHQVLEAIQAVLSDLRDAETGQRGFLLTGSPAYLQPYETGRRLAVSDLDRLAELVRDEPAAQPSMDRLNALAQAKLRELALTLQLLNTRGRSYALDAVRTGEGEQLMREISAVAAALRVHERELLTQRTQMAEEAALQARTATVAGSLVAAFMIALAFVFVARYLRQRAAAETENVRLSILAEETASRQRTFLRDVLSSVTEGRLRFCETPSELPTQTEPVCDRICLDESGGLAELRSHALTASQTCGISRDRGYDLITSASEAGMNAISHAGGGEALVCTDRHERVQIWIEDHGAGISLDQLPHATLERGFSTGGTLGHGFYMMLQMVDQVYLLTGPTGTVVVLEQFQREVPRGWIETQMAGDPPVLPMTSTPH